MSVEDVPVAPVDSPLTRSSLCLDDRKCKIAFVYRHADVMSGCCLLKSRGDLKMLWRNKKRLSIPAGGWKFFSAAGFFPAIFVVCTAWVLFTASCPHLLLSPLLAESHGLNTRTLETFLSFSTAICAAALRLNTRRNKKHNPCWRIWSADGSGQLSTPSVRPAIDYPSARGHKWPVIIWLRNIFPTSDLSLGVNQINPRRALQSMTLQLPVTCSSCMALLLHHWYVGRRHDKLGWWSLWFKSRLAGGRVVPDKYTTKKVHKWMRKIWCHPMTGSVYKKSLLFSFYGWQTWHQLVLCRDGQYRAAVTAFSYVSGLQWHLFSVSKETVRTLDTHTDAKN